MIPPTKNRTAVYRLPLNSAKSTPPSAGCLLVALVVTECSVSNGFKADSSPRHHTLYLRRTVLQFCTRILWRPKGSETGCRRKTFDTASSRALVNGGFQMVYTLKPTFPLSKRQQQSVFWSYLLLHEVHHLRPQSQPILQKRLPPVVQQPLALARRPRFFRRA